MTRGSEGGMVRGHHPNAFLFVWALIGILVGGCGSAPSGKSKPIEVVDSAEVTITESVPCDSPDKGEYTCLNLKAIVDADASNQTLDDALIPTNVILSLRLKKGATLRNRWVIFESGGHGNGYGPESGNVPPGHYEEGGRGFGDDLIRWYNEEDYVTLDIIWECPSGQPEAPCYGNPALEKWVPIFPHGSGWFRNTGGAGYAGAASRTRAVLDWVRANNGGKKVGAHGHSSGSGRLMAVLTRYRGESFFDTMVLDGGPVLTYFPWFCGITDDGDPDSGLETPGPLGPKPDEYDIEAYTPDLRSNFDNAWDIENGEGEDPYSSCTDHIWDEATMITDSNFYRATDRDFSTMDLTVVLGGGDHTPASVDARLWLQGYTFESEAIPPLSAYTLSIQQGYCADPLEPEAAYSANDNEYPCSQWDPANFPSSTGVTYVPELSSAPHSVATHPSGALDLFNTMLKTLEPNP